MLQFSFTVHDFLYLCTHIRFSISKPNFHFKKKSRISTDDFNKINLSVLQFNISDFQVSSLRNHFSEIFVEFSLANTLRLINKFQKCNPFFMESLIADFIQFSGAIAKFLFLQGRLSTRVCVL